MTADREMPIEPTARVSRAWTVRFGLLWFGYWMANLAPIQLALPNQFDAPPPATPSLAGVPPPTRPTRSATSGWSAA